MNCTPPDSIYIWASISLFPLESSEQSAYMEIKSNWRSNACSRITGYSSLVIINRERAHREQQDHERERKIKWVTVDLPPSVVHGKHCTSIRFYSSWSPPSVYLRPPRLHDSTANMWSSYSQPQALLELFASQIWHTPKCSHQLLDFKWLVVSSKIMTMYSK